MFISYLEGPGQYLPVGLIVVFGLLLIYTLLTFIRRLSTRLNRTFVFILIAAVFGLIYGACSLYFSLTPNFVSSIGGSIPNYYVNIPLILFGLAVVPMTWMSGFSVFSTLFGKGIQINLSYILAVIQLILIVAATAIYGLIISNQTNYRVYTPMYITITALSWLYFLLFFALVVRHRHELTRLGKTVLISFGIMNTVRVLVETIFINRTVTGYNDLSLYMFITFFFTDFLSAISMFLLVTFYKNITMKNDTMYDN